MTWNKTSNGTFCIISRFSFLFVGRRLYFQFPASTNAHSAGSKTSRLHSLPADLIPVTESLILAETSEKKGFRVRIFWVRILEWRILIRIPFKTIFFRQEIQNSLDKLRPVQWPRLAFQAFHFAHSIKSFSQCFLLWSKVTQFQTS